MSEFIPRAQSKQGCARRDQRGHLWPLQHRASPGCGALEYVRLSSLSMLAALPETAAHVQGATEGLGGLLWPWSGRVASWRSQL